MNVRERQREPEWMDEAGIDPQLHSEALAGLRRINWFSLSGRTLWTEIRQFMEASGLEKLTVLDVGSGGGDVVAWIRCRAVSMGVALQVDGCDVSPVALDYARRHVEATRARESRFFRHDVLSSPLPGHYDVVMCSLFMHHFDEGDALVLLDRMNRAARRLVLVQDLRRTRLGYGLAWAGCRVLSRSRVVHKDGPLSVSGAFTSDEARSLAQRAGLSRIRIRHCWPQRFLLSAESGSS